MELRMLKRGMSGNDVRAAMLLMKDKGYLESVYKAGAEKAGYVAEKTLRKVYKKVGFVAR